MRPVRIMYDLCYIWINIQIRKKNCIAYTCQIVGKIKRSSITIRKTKKKKTPSSCFFYPLIQQEVLLCLENRTDFDYTFLLSERWPLFTGCIEFGFLKLYLLYGISDTIRQIDRIEFAWPDENARKPDTCGSHLMAER